MLEYTLATLNLSGHAGQPVPNRFFRRSAAPGGLALILPGLNYTCDMPLLFYATRICQAHGLDILQLHTDYTTQAFQASSKDQQGEWLLGDAGGALRAVLFQRTYPRLLLVGKSIGSLAQSLLLLGEPAAAGCLSIWLTPLLRQEAVQQAALAHTGPGLFLGSRADGTFDPRVMERILHATRLEAHIFEGANHSLDIPGDVFASMQLHREAMLAVDGFLRAHLTAA
jgi:hypothetical protein